MCARSALTRHNRAAVGTSWLRSEDLRGLRSTTYEPVTRSRSGAEAGWIDVQVPGPGELMNGRRHGTVSRWARPGSSPPEAC